jgi:hypothetical protein
VRFNKGEQGATADPFEALSQSGGCALPFLLTIYSFMLAMEKKYAALCNYVQYYTIQHKN